MLKMPTKTLLISAAMILFAGCTTKQLPRPNAEIAELRAKEPPAAQSLPNPVKGKRFDDTWGADMKAWISSPRKTRRYAARRPASSPKSGATDWAAKLSASKDRAHGTIMPTSINSPASACTTV